MDSDSEDDMKIAEICQLVTTNMDSVILKYPRLWGLTDLPERTTDYYDVAISYPPDEFRSQFQMSRRCFTDLINKLASTGKIRNLKKKLLFTLWMLSTQDSYKSVGDRFGYSKSTAHLAFNEVLDAILSLFADYVSWPSANDYPEISQAFKEKSGGFIPGIVGAIDACHLEIRQPTNDSTEYCNDKLKYSIVLQAICDHRMIFTDVYVGSPGSLSDSDVFRGSNMYKQLDKLIPGEYHLVGDSAYPLIRNLVTPFRETGYLNEAKSRFNTALSNAGVTIERALGILKGRFKKLKFLDTCNPELVNKIVCSCVTLHNHIRMHDIDENDENLIENPILPAVYISNGDRTNVRHERTKAGSIKRNYLMSLCN